MTFSTLLGMRQRATGRSLAALMVVGSIALAGCSGDEEETGDGGAGTGAVDGASGTGGSRGTAAPEETGPPTTPMKLQVPTPKRSATSDGTTIHVEGDRAAFVTPSGNIACVLTEGTAMCSISDRTFTPPVEHMVNDLVATCAANDATAMTLPVQRGSWTCPPDDLVSTAQTKAGGWWTKEVNSEVTKVGKKKVAVLPYGMSLKVGPVSCASSEGGVNCQSNATGRRFMIARSTYSYS